MMVSCRSSSETSDIGGGEIFIVVFSILLLLFELFVYVKDGKDKTRVDFTIYQNSAIKNSENNLGNCPSSSDVHHKDLFDK